jgi:hypothetical protein
MTGTPAAGPPDARSASTVLPSAGSRSAVPVVSATRSTWRLLTKPTRSSAGTLAPRFSTCQPSCSSTWARQARPATCCSPSGALLPARPDDFHSRTDHAVEDLGPRSLLESLTQHPGGHVFVAIGEERRQELRLGQVDLVGHLRLARRSEFRHRRACHLPSSEFGRGTGASIFGLCSSILDTWIALRLIPLSLLVPRSCRRLPAPARRTERVPSGCGA